MPGTRSGEYGRFARAMAREEFKGRYWSDEQAAEVSRANAARKSDLSATFEAWKAESRRADLAAQAERARRSRVIEEKKRLKAMATIQAANDAKGERTEDASAMTRRAA